MKDNEPVKQTATPVFTTLLYEVRQRLDISWNEYVLLDMIHQLSRSGWCYKSLENMAFDMGMAKSGVVKMRDRLIHRGLVLKDKRGYTKSSVTYHKVIQREPTESSVTYHKVERPYHKVVRSVPQSGTKNYNRYTNRNKQPKKFNSNGTVSLEWKEAQLRGEVE